MCQIRVAVLGVCCRAGGMLLDPVLPATGRSRGH